MTLKPSLLAVAAFLVAAGLSAVAAQAIVRTLEDRSVEAVAAELRTQGFGWASVLGDGLQVVLEGEAPSEADRFNAISAAGEVVDGARIIDNLHVAESRPLALPDFAVEILRNDAGVSLIGLVPADDDHAEMLAELREVAAGQEVSDLLQAADYPAPEGWEPAMDYAVDALELLPDAKISVGPGRVSIEAIADSPEEKRRLESTLVALKPEGLRLALAVSAPRPVITPFTFRATLEGGRLSFDACSAETEEARDAILSAAAAIGAQGPLDCRLGLGAPSADWGAAVATGLAALHELGGGTITFSDLDVHLVALSDSDRALFDRVTGELDGALPDDFAFSSDRPAPIAEAPQGPPEFTAALAAEGTVRLSGRIDDDRMNGLVRAFAQARFGAEDVVMATRPGAAGLPDGWTMRVLTGIEALSRLSEGRVTVTPDRVAVEGRTGDKAARDEIAARAIETLGPGATLDLRVAYDESLDPLAALPTPEECLAKIAAVTDAAKITFDPGSATISREGEPVIEAIAEILRACPDLRLRIAGYTDSQGRESSNLELSQARAESVLAALRAERVPVAGFEAVGFGEADPIASNDTEEGRERNRRIEFSLIGAPAAAVPPDATAESAPPDPDAPLDGQPMAEAPDAPPLRPRLFELLDDQDTTETRIAGSEGNSAPSAPPEAPAAAASTGGEDEADVDVTAAPPVEAGPATTTSAESFDGEPAAATGSPSEGPGPGPAGALSPSVDPGPALAATSPPDGPEDGAAAVAAPAVAVAGSDHGATTPATTRAPAGGADSDDGASLTEEPSPAETEKAQDSAAEPSAPDGPTEDADATEPAAAPEEN